MKSKNLPIYMAIGAVAVSVSITNPASAEVSFEWTTVRNPGNGPDPLVFGVIPNIGSVADVYRIAKHEVTNAQYAEFLNAVAVTDPRNAYSINMGIDVRGGITRSGSAGSYAYAVKPNMGNKPVNFVSFVDAMRFANWLHNSQPNGAQDITTTEGGAYFVTSEGTDEPREPGARFFIPTENEWYKAAYYQPTAEGGDSDGYWLYPTAGNTLPATAMANAVGDIINGDTEVANYNFGADWNGLDGNVTTVGSAGPISESYYGTSDQGGNVWEWNELMVNSTLRGLRGGSWDGSGDHLMSSFVGNATLPSSETFFIGFRVATRAFCSIADGDMDCDGDVDLADFALLQNLLLGPQ